MPLPCPGGQSPRLRETRDARGAILLSCRLLERRAGIQCRRTAQIARMRLIVWATAMHGAAIVPDHEIADAPAMAIDELGLCRVRVEIPQQQTAFSDWPADNVR